MEHLTISSRANPRIQHLKKLLRDREYRYAEGQYVVEGLRALDGIARAEAVFVSDDAAVPPVPADEVYIVDREILHQVAATENSQGVLAVLKLDLRDARSIDRRARYVLLDRLQDPGNMGTIIRTAAAFGVKGIIVTAGSVDPFSPKVVRSAAGALRQLEVIGIDRPEQLQDCTVVATDAGGQDIARAVWPQSFILAVGNEANGLSDGIRARASMTVAIPMPGCTESLNAAVAAGIMLYCATKTR